MRLTKTISYTLTLSLGVFFLFSSFAHSATTPPPVYPPSANISASPNPIYTRSAGNTTLTWSSTGATSCTVIEGEKSGFDTGGATSGSDSSSPISVSTTFAISCTGAGGTATDSVTVSLNGDDTNPPVTGSCSANRTTATTDQSVTWTAVPSGGNNSYTYSWSGTSGLSGSSISTSKTYTSAGTKTASVTITSDGDSTTVNCSNSVVVSLTAPPAASLICPANGEEFEPSNSDFLGLVGNELQIALYYGASIPYLAQKYADAGVKNVRIILNWENIESTEGSFNWNYVDVLSRAFSEEDIEPVGIISKTPQWASSCPSSTNYHICIAQDLNKYRNFVRRAVQRYGAEGNDRIHNWEIRVEALPNRNMLTKEQYVTELNAAYAVIKEEDPDARVWGPEVAFVSSSPSESESSNVYTWIDHVIANGLFDVFSVHHLAATTPAVALAHTERVRDRLDDAGKENVPLAITAMALTNPAGTPEAQAQNLKDLYACVSSGGADYALWFAGTEWAGSGSVLDDVTYGIFDYVLDTPSVPERVRPKLAYYALKELGDSMEENNIPPPDPTPGDDDDDDDDDSGGGGGGGSDTGGSDDPIILLLMEKLIGLLRQYLLLLLAARGQ